MKTMVTGCPAEIALHAIRGRWKVFILFQLLKETLRFSDLQRSISNNSANGVTPKMLTQELRQMEADGLVHREVYAQVPPKVEYSLTPLGESLRSVVDAMVAWGRQQQKQAESNDVEADNPNTST